MDINTTTSRNLSHQGELLPHQVSTIGEVSNFANIGKPNPIAEVELLGSKSVPHLKTNVPQTNS